MKSWLRSLELLRQSRSKRCTVVGYVSVISGPLEKKANTEERSLAAMLWTTTYYTDRTAVTCQYPLLEVEREREMSSDHDSANAVQKHCYKPRWEHGRLELTDDPG